MIEAWYGEAKLQPGHRQMECDLTENILSPKKKRVSYHIYVWYGQSAMLIVHAESCGSVR